MKRIRWLVVALLMLMVILLSGCQTAMVPIKATYDLAGPPVVGEPTNFDNKCLLPMQYDYAFSGTFEGTMSLNVNQLFHGPCIEDMIFAMYDEHRLASGTFEGSVDGREGTFEFFQIAQLEAQHYTGQLAILPGSGTGQLVGLSGVINFDERAGDAPPWPVTGNYYFAPTTVTVSAPQAASPVDQTTIVTDRLAPETIAAIEDVVEAKMTELNVPGIAVGVVLDRELVYAKGFGVTAVGGDQPVTPQTVFQLSSIAKTTTSTAIMQLVEADKIDLDAPVTDYLPYFELADSRGGEITIRQLLTHTSGMPDNDWTDPNSFEAARYDNRALEDHVRSMKSLSLLHDPGTHFEYSGMGFGILGDVIAKVSGMPYEEYVADHVFAQAGMQQTTLLLAEVDRELMAMPHVPNAEGATVENSFIPYTRVFGPDSMLYSNVEDMTKYAIAHLQRGAGEPPALLSPEDYDLVWTYHVETPFPPPENYYGYGWQLGEYQGERVVGHSGIDIGYNTSFQMLPDKSAALIVFSNYNDLNEFVLPAFELRVPLLDILIDALTE